MHATLTQLDVEKELQSYGLELLKPYERFPIPLVYLCSCGGIGKKQLGNIRRTQELGSVQKCPHCVENTWRERFLQRNCEIIIWASSEEVTYRCTCGAVSTGQPQNWLRRGLNCPVCREHWNKKEFPAPARPNLYSWKKQVLVRDNFECCNCWSAERLNIHHIEAYSARLDLAISVSNGITLCLKCHKDLHKLYGHNVGLINLELALGYMLPFREVHRVSINTLEQ